MFEKEGIFPSKAVIAYGARFCWVFLNSEGSLKTE